MNGPKSTILKGRIGEAHALQYFLSLGFRLREKNYRHKKGEIDIIVQKDNLLVFAEVKYRRTERFGYPEEFVSQHQQSLIINTADHFIQESGWKGNIRFDIIAINGQKQIEHFEDAFY